MKRQEIIANKANLSGADLSGADLHETCLDPEAPIPEISDREILEAGMEIDGEHILAWRTRNSQYVGSTEYTPGTYTAPVFSVSQETECHPGIYFASVSWLKAKYGRASLVRVRVLRNEAIHVGDKWRAKRIEVLP